MSENQYQNITASKFYKLIDNEFIDEAYQYITTNNISLKSSTKYLVIVNNKPFPPKDFIRVIAKLKGYKIEENTFSGGQANAPFERLGYIIENTQSVKKRFASWLLENGANSYKDYYGNSIDEIEVKLDEINSFFDIDIFKLENNSNKKLMLFLNENIYGANREKNKDFFDYDKLKGNGRPKAILGKKNYFIFLESIKMTNHQINNKLFNSYWNRYKEYFRLPDSEQPEQYKWSVLKQVYDKWNWNSNDKAEMFKNAFNVTGSKNLWESGNFFPIGHTSWMLDNFKTETINAFDNLFNEDLVLLDRVNSFIEFYDEMLPRLQELVPDKKINYHSHGDLRAIALYLSLQYPQKYFLFKFGMVKDFCQKMELPKIKRGKKENLDTYINISNQVLTLIKEDTSFINEYREFTNKAFNYNDKSLHLLTQDFIYSVANHFEEEHEVSFIEHFALWLDKKTDVFYENLIVQVKTFVDGLTERGEVEKKQLDSLEKNTLKILLKEFKNTKIITDNKANYFEDFLKELTMEKHLIFELYREYLISVRRADLQYGTVVNYVNNAKDVITIRWKKLYGLNFEVFEINFKNLQQFEPLLRSGFSGHNSFQWFINDLLKEYKLKVPLNKILYGAPGTGKTYKTKKLAVEIIENVEYSDSKEDRDIILEKYESYIDSENIYFTTFHQSMGYEDFIEGIKPKMDEDEEKEISYKVEDGIFKIICKKASNSLGNLTSFRDGVEVMSFDKVWTQLINSYTEESSKSKKFTLPTSTDMGMDIVGVTNKGNLLLKPSKGSDLDYTVSYNRMQKLFNAIPDLSVVKNIDKEFREVIGGANSTAYWCVLNYLLNWIKNNKEQLELVTTDTKNEQSNFVLIIDEINRGNVSAIFGELITLIEDDKRAGEKEVIDITLPYSKLKFSVPSNVFIIGTMNTADRSVEAIDTALRRRFSFEEVSPQPELLKDLEYQEVDLEKVLDSINKRIELLIDKDHQIGHSYFFRINSLDDLKLVFKDKILPLLEEYFYGDFGKIGLVLGENFIEELQLQNKNILATFKAYNDVDFVSDKQIFRLKNIDEMTEEDFISIYQDNK